MSSGHRLIAVHEVTDQLARAWQSEHIPARQRELVESELKRMHRGDVLPIYRILAEAVQETGAPRGKIVEVGCASGYYAEVLEHLLGRSIDYVGIDYSEALLNQAHEHYPALPFVQGDACSLPLADEACDILISGCVMLHVPDYRRVIAETARVTRGWAIFHRTPVLQNAPTTYYSKMAYGVRCVELAFNERELLDLFAQAGLTLVRMWSIGEHGIEGAVEQAVGKTFLCRKMAGARQGT